MMDKFFTVVSTLFVLQLFFNYHEVSAESCRAIYGERFRCISPDACAKKNRAGKTRCGPKANGVCCQVMDEDHRNFKRCGIPIQRHVVHRHHPYGSSLKHFQPSSESMRALEKIDIPWVILANKGSDSGGNWFQNDYIALSNSKQGFYRSRKNSNNQEENTDNDRYSVKNYVKNSSATSRNSKLKIEVTNEIAEVSTKYDSQLNNTLYNNGENIKMFSVDLLKSTNPCSTIGCSTNIIKSVVNDDVTEASNETSKKLKGSEEIYFKNYEIPTNSQISIIENNKTFPEDINQFITDNFFNETFEGVANSTETVTNTIVSQFSEESLKHSLGQEDTLNNSFDAITTDEEQFNNTNGEYNDNETMKTIENSTKLQDESSVVEAVESEEKGNLEDNSELLKIFSSENTVAVENENTSKLISESEQKTNSESFVEVTNENYSSQELKSEKTIITQNTFELSNGSFSKLMSEYEETTNVQPTQYKEEFELVKKTHLDGSSELVTENSIEEKTAAGEEEFSDIIFPEEEEKISIPYSEYEKKAISGVSVELLNESSLTQEFGLLNENSSLLVSESKTNTNVQENAESTNETHYKKEYELKEKTNLEGSSEIVTESALEESAISGEDYFSEATTVEEKEENLSKSDTEAKGKTISNIFTEMTDKNSFSQESKSEETIHAENTFEFPNENSSEFVSESEETTNVRETAESTNKTHYTEEHELEEKTNLEGSSESMTQSPSEESTISGEDYFSEAMAVEEKEENISKSDSEAKDKTISNISIEMTNETSFSQESKSEEKIHAENTFEFPNENSSEFVHESENTTNVQETAESTNETHYKEEQELEENTNLEGSSESMTESPLEESTTSGEDYFSEATTVKEKEKNISISDSEDKEKTISNISIEMINEISFSQESKSEETIHAENISEFPNENSSEFVSESEETTNVQETAESTNKTHYTEKHELEEKTNLEGSRESMTESPLEESTTSGEDYFSEATTVKHKEENISKSDSEAKEKTISNISIEMTNETSFSQESKSEETIHAENSFEFPNENSSEFVSESEETTNVRETAESTNKTHYTEENELEEKTNLEGSSESLTQSPSEESTISGEDYFSEAMTVEEKEENISKSDSEAKEKTISNISTEITNSFSQESKSEETIKAEDIFELPNETSSEFVSTFAESTNKTHYEEEVVKKTNLNDSSEIVTESSLEERAILGEKNFSETTAEAQSISKLESESENKTISEISVEITNINSLSQESNSEDAANAEFTEISKEITSKLISESEEITNADEIFESLNETNYEEGAGLEIKTNLDASGELVTENPSNEMTISKEEIFYETTVDVENENISKPVSESEGNRENSFEVSNEDSLNKELKSENTSNVDSNTELQNANTSIFESETKETTSVQQTSGMSNETYLQGETKLEVYTNLEGSSKLVTENSLKENTISEENIFSETTIEAQKESISKTSLSAEMTNSENFVEIKKETSSNGELKSVETTKMFENVAFTNETHYKDELQLKEKTNLEDSSEIVTENSLKESAISEEDIFSEPTVEVEKEKLTKTNSESEKKTISQISIEMTNINSLSQESKTEELINAQITFELPNENYSKLMPDSKETTNVQKTAEFLNETNYEEEVDSEEKTNLESSSELMSESFLEERTTSREEDIFETTVEAEKEYVTKPDSKFEAETNSEKFVEIANENSSIKESESEEKINSHNSFEFQNGNASKLEFESEGTTNVQESAKLTVESTTNLEGSNKLTNVSPVEEIKDEAENSNTSKEMSEFDEQSSSEVSIKVVSKNSSRQESESEETIYAQNTLELPNEDSSKLVSEAQETANVQETGEMTNETHYNEELELRKKTSFLSSSESMTEKYLRQRTLSEEDFSDITFEAETKNISTEVSEIEQKTNTESFFEVTNENSSGQLSESEVTVNSKNTFKLPIEGSSDVFVSEETTSIQETVEFTNEKKTNLDGGKLANESSSEVEGKNTETSKEVSQSEEKSNSKSFVKVTNGNSLTHQPESEKSTKEQNTFQIANEDSLNIMSKPEKTANIQETYELMNVTHYKPEFEEKSNFEDSNQLAYKSTFKEEPISGRDAFSGTTVETENKSTSKGVFEYEEKTNSQIVAEIENENSSTQKSESEETTNEKNNIEIVNENSSKIMYEFEETTNLQKTVKSSIELENGTLHKETSKPEQETDLKIVSRVTNNNSYSVMPESKEANLTEMTFGNEQNILFSTSIFAENSIPEATVTAVNEAISVQMPKSEEETITESTFKQEHEKFYNGFPEIQVKREGLSDERFHKNISESKKEEKLENNTQQMNENLYKGVSESIEESRINSKATMKDSTGNFHKVTSASKKDSDQENATELSNVNITDKTTISEEKNTESVTLISNENIAKETNNKTEEKTIWETIIESVTKMFSKQVSESGKINLMSTAEMSNEGYSKTAYEYEEKANQVSTENFYKDISEFKKDIDAVSSEKLTSEKYNHEVSEVKAETTKAYTDEINSVRTSEEVNEYKENINLQSTVGSAGKKSYTGVSDYEEKTNTEILDEAKEESDKQISELLLDASPGISAEVENEDYPKGTSEIEETINLFNNYEKISVGEKSYTGVTAYEEKNNTETLDIAKEDSDKQISELLLDASPGISAKVENEDYPKGTSEIEETINPFNNSEKISVGEKSYTGVYAYEEKNNTETLDIAKEDSDKQISELLLDASPGISAKVENEDYPKGTSEIEETINPFNNSVKLSEGYTKDVYNHTQVRNLERKIELTTGNFYKESIASKENINLQSTVRSIGEKSYTGVSAYEEKTNIEILDIAKEDRDKQISELLLDASPGISAKVENEDYPKGTSETEETINPFNNSVMVFEGYTKDLSNHTQIRNLERKIELTTGNFYKESIASKENISVQSTVGSVGEKSYTGVSAYEERTNTETLDIAKEDNDKQISELLLDASPGISAKVENEDYPKGTSEIEETINPFNNSEKVFEGYTKDLSNHTQIRNLERKIELTTGNFYKESIASKEEANPISSSVLMLEITKTEVPKILVDASMKTSREMANENISTDKFESEKMPNLINNSEMVFEDYSKNVFGHTKSTNVESNTELRKESSYKKITGSVQEANPNKSISNGITSHVMIEDEIWDKTYGTTTEEEIRLSNTDIKFYDGRENIHPGYTNEKEFHNSHTEISEYSTNNKKNLDIKIATSSSNKTSKTVTELNKKSNISEILTKASIHVTRTEIALEGAEENVTIIDLGNLTNNSYKEIHESSDSNTNITTGKLLTEVSSENVLSVSDSFDFTTKYPNHFSNTESEIYKSNNITTSQDFVVNEKFSLYKETSKYLEDASDNSESITEDQIQFSNAEINFQLSEANFNLQDAASSEGVEIQMNSSASYVSFSETSTNEIFTNVSNENTRRTIEEYDTLDEEVTDITTKHKKKFSNDEISFHENEEKMTEGIFLETFITDVNETSTEAGEVLSKYFDISTEKEIQITNPDIHLHKNVQNISIHKALELQDVKNEDRTESNNKNVSFLTSDNDFYEISDDFSKVDKTENENFVATTKSQFHFNNTETEIFDGKEIASKDTQFYISELNSKITTEFGNINSFKNMSLDSKNVPENVTFPIFIDDSAGRFSHVINGNKNSNKNFVITTEKQFHFNRTETELYENEESISPREVDKFANSSANVEISNYETGNVKIIKNSSADVDDDKYSTQKAAEAQFLNSSEDIDKGTLVKTKYTMDSLKHDFTSKYNTYSTFIEKKYSKYPDETIQQFMMKTTAVPPKLDHTDHLNAYKHDILKMSTYHKDNTKLQPLENINKYYDYGGQSFNSIRQAARDEYHKAYFLSKMFENQPAFAKMVQHPMFYQNPNFMNERPVNFPGPYYESKLLQHYAQSYPYLYDQFHVNYPVSRFYQAGLYQQPLFSHNMVNSLPNNYRPFYGSENYQPSIQSYPSMYNKRDLRNMYPSKPVDFSTFHQKGFYRQPNPMYMIVNPSLRRYRRSYGRESLQHTVQPNPSILKAYSLKKIEENQFTDLPKYHQVGLNQQLNHIYGITESLLNKDNIYFLADSHPFFVKTHLNVLAPFEGKGQLDEFANKEGGIIQEKPEISHFETKNGPPRKQHIKKRKRYTKNKLRNGNRSLNSVVKKRGTELPAFTENSKKSFNHKKGTFGMGSTEEPFRQAYRESIDRYNLLHVIEYLPPEKTYRKRIFNNETLDVTENKSIKYQTAHYSILDKILSTSTDYYKVPAGEKYFTNEYTVRKNKKYSKGKSEGDKLIEKSKIKGKRQKEELKPVKRNLNRMLISETQNTSQEFKNSNSYQENTLNSYVDEKVTLFNDLDAVLNDVEFFPLHSEVQKTNVRRSNVPGISRKEANLQEGRTIGGKLEYENWPWIVSIYKLPDMFHVCSGTLIDDRHILTAAHCFLGHDYEEYVASVGSLMKISDPNQGYLVEDKIIHADFKKDCYCNDIALLRLKYPVDKHLTPICLSAIDTAVVGENTTLLGWGDMKFMAGRGKSGTDRLQRLNNLPITSSEECRKVYSRILDRDLSRNFSESYVCAGVPDGSKDACVGDSGGPLLHRSYDGSWTLLGVVSFGYKCGAPGVPGIYTRVSYYLQWIYGAIDKFDLSHLHDKPHSN